MFLAAGYIVYFDNIKEAMIRIWLLKRLAVHAPFLVDKRLSVTLRMVRREVKLQCHLLIFWFDTKVMKMNNLEGIYE